MIKVQPYEGRYNEQVIRHILNIQQNEFGVPITINDQQDLLAIENFYQKDNGNFWIAMSGDQLVGTIALIDMGNGEGALRKMFVDRDFRGSGHGVATKLLEELLSWMKVKKMTAVYLGTVDILKAAQRFYEKYGFIVIPENELPVSFPKMKVDTRFYACYI